MSGREPSGGNGEVKGADEAVAGGEGAGEAADFGFVEVVVGGGGDAQEWR